MAPLRRARSTEGFSLIEVAFALGILMVVALGVLLLGVIATNRTENEGHLVGRTAEYAQDKLEQLLALSYGNTTSDTRQFPTAVAGGTGLAVGGSSNPAAPVALYVDYLDIDSGLLASAGTAALANWFYRRVWQISSPAGTANLKQITVTATVKIASGNVGRVPLTTVSSLKTFPF